MTLCDIGNTTFSFFNLEKNRELKVPISTKYDKLPEVKKTLYFISVNQKAEKKLLKKYPNAINCAKLIKFKTTYKGMGIDRQIACYGMNDVIIVDVGSAITVDIMKKNKHKGGFILSGIKNLSSFYPLISSKLKFKYKKDIKLKKIPTNTDDAITYAILKSIILPIKEIEKRYNLPVYFTGEDSIYLMKYFKKAQYKKTLIFDNMQKLIKANFESINV